MLVDACFMTNQIHYKSVVSRGRGLPTLVMTNWCTLDETAVYYCVCKMTPQNLNKGVKALLHLDMWTPSLYGTEHIVCV